MATIDSLEEKLKEIEEKLEDAEARMPAHSVKPLQMTALFQLEEERDALAAEIRKYREEQGR
jgi:hypothetical protein